jgi:hypothetical protein
MIYGYDLEAVKDQGLKRTKEICFSISNRDILEMAEFFMQSALKIQGSRSFHGPTQFPYVGYG